MLISIIICTRDRADDLHKTLCSMATVKIPKNCTCELLVVDNASQDDTPAVISQAKISNMTLRLLSESNPGQSNARNLGLVEARGEIIIFTDDDIRFTPEWLEEMSLPLLRREADATTGTMLLAPNLERQWMKPMHRMWLAAPPKGFALFAGTLIGANMGFHRKVLDRVPGFDTELGPGAMGFGDDTLFGHQLGEAGYLITTISLRSEHHFRPERLARESFHNHAIKLGKSAAYMAHHWEHEKTQMPQLNLIRKMAQLAVWRRTHWAEVQRAEGMHTTEMHHLRSLHLFGQFLIERRRPRNYERHGLVKKISVA